MSSQIPPFNPNDLNKFLQQMENQGKVDPKDQIFPGSNMTKGQINKFLHQWVKGIVQQIKADTASEKKEYKKEQAQIKKEG